MGRLPDDDDDGAPLQQIGIDCQSLRSMPGKFIVSVKHAFLTMKGWVIDVVLVVFFLAGSDFLELSCSSTSTLPAGPHLVDGALAGGGFGVPKKRGGASVGDSRSQPHPKSTPTSNNKKRKGRWIVDVPQSDDNKSDPTPAAAAALDKWGLPPPTLEDIFPLMPPGTELIPVESSKDYSLAEMQQALQHHIPLTKLALRFDEHGVERIRTAASSSAAVDHWNDAEQQQQQQRSMKLRLLHQSPPVLVIDHFLTTQECQEIYQIAVPNDNNVIETDTSMSPNTKTTATPRTLQPAVQVESKTFSVLAQSRRTSTSWFCYYQSVPTLLAKTRDVLGMDLHQLEEPQIVRYQSGQEFSWHYDQVPTPQLGNGGQRLATLLVYLNTVPDGGGGGTVFRDLRDCHGHTLTVQPVQGTALLFFPAFGDGRPDDRTLHRGEPILDVTGTTGEIAEKRIVQMWIHQGSYRAAVPPHNRQRDAVAAVNQVSQRLGYYTSSTGPRADVF